MNELQHRLEELAGIGLFVEVEFFGVLSGIIELEQLPPEQVRRNQWILNLQVSLLMSLLVPATFPQLIQWFAARRRAILALRSALSPRGLLNLTLRRLLGQLSTTIHLSTTSLRFLIQTLQVRHQLIFLGSQNGGGAYAAIIRWSTGPGCLDREALLVQR